MRLPCEVIEDLLILYDDDACSEESRHLVEKHLLECERCNKYLRKLEGTEEFFVPQMSQEVEEETEAVKSGFQKIRRRWQRALTGVVMLLPVLLVILLSVNEIRGEGIALTNLDDIYRGWRYLRYIEKGKYEKAVECVDFRTLDRSMIDGFKDMPEDEFVAYMKERYVEKLQEYYALGLSIDHIVLDTAYRVSIDEWQLYYDFTEYYPDGSCLQKAGVGLDGNDLTAFTTSRPLNSNKEMYLTSVFFVRMQEDPMNYSKYETSFILKEGEKAQIFWEGMQNVEGTIREVYLLNKDMDIMMYLNDLLYRVESIEAVVPGEYSLGCYVYDKEERIDLADYVQIEIIDY